MSYISVAGRVMLIPREKNSLLWNRISHLFLDFYAAELVEKCSVTRKFCSLLAVHMHAHTLDCYSASTVKYLAHL